MVSTPALDTSNSTTAINVMTTGDNVGIAIGVALICALVIIASYYGYKQYTMKRNTKRSVKRTPVTRIQSNYDDEEDVLGMRTFPRE